MARSASRRGNEVIINSDTPTARGLAIGLAFNFSSFIHPPIAIASVRQRIGKTSEIPVKNASCLVLLAFTVLTGCASTKQEIAAPTGAPEMKLPPGWTEADMQACMAAATPGKQHEKLLADVGVWKGKNTLWMYPGAEPVTSDATCTMSSFLDGRYVKVDWYGEIPGMGPYKGFGLTGYDNISQKYVNLWIDNMATSMMTGTGVLSADGTTMTWSFDYICPITKKSAVFRQIEKTAGPGRKTLEMYGIDPKGGKEYKMMLIEMSKK